MSDIEVLLTDYSSQETEHEEDLDNLTDAVSEIVEEYMTATANFGKFASRHEGVAIIQEEFEEFKEAAFWPHKDHTGEPDVEVIQLAAMCLRYMMDITRGK